MKCQIQYNLFNEMSRPIDYNFYGVISNISTPKFDEKTSTFEITLKLIDPTTNWAVNVNKNHNDLTLIIKANLKENIPITHTIGDIIRVNNGKFNPIKNTVSLIWTTVTRIKSNWCWFKSIPAKEDDDNDKMIISSSSWNINVDESDLHNVNEMRQWARSNLQIKNSLKFNEIKLKNRKRGSTGNSIVWILNKYENESTCWYWIQDETERIELNTGKYFNYLQINTIVCISNYYCELNGTLCLKKDTNIMTLPEHCELCKTFRMTNKYDDESNEALYWWLNKYRYSTDSKWIYCIDVIDTTKVVGKFNEINTSNNLGIVTIRIDKLLYPTIQVLKAFAGDNPEQFDNFVFECVEEKTEQRLILSHFPYMKDNSGFINMNAVIDSISALLNSVNKYSTVLIKWEEIGLGISCEKVKIYRIIGNYRWNDINIKH